MNKEVSARIDMLRIILISGILLIHIPFTVDILARQTFVFQYIQLLGERTFFRAAVPTLSIISGYLLFNSLAKRQFSLVLRSKIDSLLIPLVLWNLPLVVAVYFLQKFSLVGHAFRLELYPFNLLNFLDAVFSITEGPVNFPLAFIRDIFACVLIAPLLAIVLRRAAWLGLAILFALVLIDVNIYIVLRKKILLAFYLGGMIATRKWDLTALDHFRWWFMALFAAACAAIALVATRYIGTTGPSPVGALVDCLRLIGPLAFWGLSAALYRSRFAAALTAAARYSFFLFCTHGPFLVALWILWGHWAGDQTVALYPVFYVIAPVVTFCLALGSYHLLQRFVPGLLSLLTGQRAALAKMPGKPAAQGVATAAKQP